MTSVIVMVGVSCASTVVGPERSPPSTSTTRIRFTPKYRLFLAQSSIRGLTVVGLFAGIGGIELGLHRAGHETSFLCEIDDAATQVLRARFPEVAIQPDVRELRSLPRADVVAAGLPCQDLSQAGLTAGIGGRQSGLIEHVFRLVERRHGGPRWLLVGLSQKRNRVQAQTANAPSLAVYAPRTSQPSTAAAARLTAASHPEAAK